MEDLLLSLELRTLNTTVDIFVFLLAVLLHHDRSLVST